jgi:glyoxylase-like metal-dependent hydrolase (beta-lactamase superfamily II)
MKTEVDEIAAGLYRLSTFLPSVGPTGFTFNQFLVVGDEALLFHYGQRALFPLIADAVKRVIPLERLRWLICSHGEADESGALNEWLAAAPNATPAHGMVGCNIWLRDASNKEPRVLKNDEVIDLGGKRVRWLDTPHMPHGWDAGLIWEETTSGRCSPAISSPRSAGTTCVPIAISWRRRSPPSSACPTCR